MILGPLLVGVAVLVAWMLYTGTWERAMLGSAPAAGAA